MPKESLDKTLHKSLFLICPMDSMEKRVLQRFEDEVFFYTALGVCFEFDMNTQLKLWDLIYENDIDQIVFVLSLDSSFYKPTFNDSPRSVHSTDRIRAIQQKTSRYIVHSELFLSNYYILIERYLTNQKERLLSTPYLGGRLKEMDITVLSYVFHPQDASFYNLQEVKEWGYLLSGFSHN